MAFYTRLSFPHFQIAYNILLFDIIFINIVKSLMTSSLTFYVALRFLIMRHILHCISFVTRYSARGPIINPLARTTLFVNSTWFSNDVRICEAIPRIQQCEVWRPQSNCSRGQIFEELTQICVSIKHFENM